MTSTQVEPSATSPDRTTPSRRTGWAWVAGVVAGMSGLAIAELVTWLVAPLGSPLSAVGSSVINLLPPSLINFGKETLGFADKPVLLVLVGVVALVISGVSGRLEYARPWAGVVGPLLLAVLSIIAISQQPDVSGTTYAPVIIGLPVAYVILRLLISRLRLFATSLPGPDSTTDRRRFLIMTGAVAAASVFVGGASRVMASGKSMALQARSMIKLPAPAEPAPVVPSGADLKINQLTPYVTANDTFYRIDTALQVPIVNPADWSLRIIGMVEREVEITFDELLRLPLSEFYVTLTCVSNEVGGNLAGNAKWLGYPIRELLSRAGPKPGADMVLSRSVDGFTAGSPLSALTDPDRDAIVAVGMNGQPLPAEHGFPARLVVPGLYGYVSATKWVSELKVTSYADDEAYWTPRGWSARGPLKLASRIDTPSGDVKAGRVAVAGVAWAQHTGISQVEVRVDNGPWRKARLADAVSADTWRQWVYEWDASPGEHRLTVRATDTDGLVQTSVEAPPAPNGSTGWHSVTVQVN
ncbi:MAG TPA: molybdopterin-dependent oxidoreductase [Microlunatus sp.]